MDNGLIEATKGMLEFLFKMNNIVYRDEDFYWVSNPQGHYKTTKLKGIDVQNALACKIEDDGDYYDLEKMKCIPKQRDEY